MICLDCYECAHWHDGPFLMGEGKPKKDAEKPFMVTFDWVILPRNFQKIKEGQYERR